LVYFSSAICSVSYFPVVCNEQRQYLLQGFSMPLAGKPISGYVSMYVQFGLDLFREENAIELGIGE